MGRVHLFEILDQPWCPGFLRDAGTDYLRFAEKFAKVYEPVVPILRDALEKSGATRIVDIGSGGAGPWLDLYDKLDGLPQGDVEVCLTDLSPNTVSFEAAKEASGGKIAYRSDSVDATDVPEDLHGFRTMCSSFHHFRPDMAKAILADAVKKTEGIAVFEFTHRSPVGILIMLLVPLMVLLMVPMIKPFRVSRLIATYLPPLLPFVACFDGIVSALRTYSVAELEDLTRDLDGFDWDIGLIEVDGAPIPGTYLIGLPK